MEFSEDPMIDSFWTLPLAQYKRELEEAERELFQEEESDVLYEARIVSSEDVPISFNWYRA
jgi:hypothetical protein